MYSKQSNMLKNFFFLFLKSFPWAPAFCSVSPTGANMMLTQEAQPFFIQKPQKNNSIYQCDAHTHGEGGFDDSHHHQPESLYIFFPFRTWTSIYYTAATNIRGLHLFFHPPGVPPGAEIHKGARPVHPEAQTPNPEPARERWVPSLSSSAFSWFVSPLLTTNSWHRADSLCGDWGGTV